MTSVQCESLWLIVRLVIWGTLVGSVTLAVFFAGYWRGRRVETAHARRSASGQGPE